MSNDITPNRLPPAVVPSTPEAKPAEPVRAPAVEAAQPVVETQPQPQPQPDPLESRRSLQEASEQLNQQMRRNGRDLSFSVDDVANKVVLTVKNKEGEVVRQIPDEVALRVAHNIENMKGLMQDEKS